MTDQIVHPFLRWAGGKRWLAAHLSPSLRKILDETGGIYYEPFLGAGSMYFGLAPQESILSDLNKELIDTYAAVRDSWQEIENKMSTWVVSKEKYYAIRTYKPRNAVNKAARFIWLNRTCYGGLYRVNQKNQFNVPYGGGRTPEVLYKNGILKQCSDALLGTPYTDRSVKLVCADFEEIIAQSKEGDVVYCDPTYSCVTRDSFDRYGANIFDWNSQKRLASVALEASFRGATIIISNARSGELSELFSFNYLVELSKKKTIGNFASNSKKHKEYLFILDPHQRTNHWKSFGKSISGTCYHKSTKVSIAKSILKSTRYITSELASRENELHPKQTVGGQQQNHSVEYV